MEQLPCELIQHIASFVHEDGTCYLYTFAAVCSWFGRCTQRQLRRQFQRQRAATRLQRWWRSRRLDDNGKLPGHGCGPPCNVPWTVPALMASTRHAWTVFCRWCGQDYTPGPVAPRLGWPITAMRVWIPGSHTAEPARITLRIAGRAIFNWNVVTRKRWIQLLLPQPVLSGGLRYVVVRCERTGSELDAAVHVRLNAICLEAYDQLWRGREILMDEYVCYRWRREVRTSGNWFACLRREWRTAYGPKPKRLSSVITHSLANPVDGRLKLGFVPIAYPYGLNSPIRKRQPPAHNKRHKRRKEARCAHANDGSTSSPPKSSNGS